MKTLKRQERQDQFKAHGQVLKSVDLLSFELFISL